MPDLQRVDQILALARVLSRIPTGNKARPYMGTPAPILSVWATELHDDFGVRVHKDLARKEMIRLKTPLGNNGPVQAVPKGTLPAADDTRSYASAHAQMMDWLRAKMPDLATEVEAAQNDPELAAIVLNRIRTDFPEVWAKGQEIMAAAEGSA